MGRSSLGRKLVFLWILWRLYYNRKKWTFLTTKKLKILLVKFRLVFSGLAFCFTSMVVWQNKFEGWEESLMLTFTQRYFLLPCVMEILHMALTCLLGLVIRCPNPLSFLSWHNYPLHYLQNTRMPWTYTSACRCPLLPSYNTHQWPLTESSPQVFLWIPLRWCLKKIHETPFFGTRREVWGGGGC